MGGFQATDLFGEVKLKKWILSANSGVAYDGRLPVSKLACRSSIR